VKAFEESGGGGICAETATESCRTTADAVHGANKWLTERIAGLAFDAFSDKLHQTCHVSIGVPNRTCHRQAVSVIKLPVLGRVDRS
jgi:hypothetical protein